MTVENLAIEEIFFLFRGGKHQIAPGAVVVLDSIPDELYPYSTVFQMPASCPSYVMESELRDTLRFADSKYYLLYWSSIDTASIYHIGCSVSGSNSL